MAAGGGAQAAGPQPLDIQVQPGAFGRVSAADITAVLQSAADEVWRYCPDIHLAGIDVYGRGDHPQTDFRRTARGRIAVGLSAHDAFWTQYSFQFAHEFCHVLANYSNGRQPARDPRPANFWLEESLCETASLFTLEAMARSWRNDPPYPAWRSYAPWFQAYVGQRLARREYHLPAGVAFPDWFRVNEAALRRNPTMWGRNTIIATQLLPLFQAGPRGWEAVAFLHRGAPGANQSLAQYLSGWRSHSPGKLHPFIERVAAVFGVKL